MVLKRVAGVVTMQSRFLVAITTISTSSWVVALLVAANSLSCNGAICKPQICDTVDVLIGGVRRYEREHFVLKRANGCGIIPVLEQILFGISSVMGLTIGN